MQKVTIESVDVTLSSGGKFIGVMKVFLNLQYHRRPTFMPSQTLEQELSKEEIEELKEQILERIGENFSGVMEIGNDL